MARLLQHLLSRRRFLGGVGLSVVGISIAKPPPRNGGFGSTSFGSNPFGA